MMDVREKLVELLEPHMSGLACEYESGSCELTSCRSCNARNIVDHLISNGVAIIRHGRWLYDSGSGKYFCSACDADALSFKKDALYGGDLYEVCLTDYCPSCGAKMDGGAD